ncbi:SDR family NAD(P)-dependent oxidoreductase [Novosphingobium malaysiense]|uniref:Oxidoreductase n=1 Tax=Novosphingobium malaysiense TaxID=1348853 RepID=A0A0B1ZIN7_9SPHN|nr:SDR family oxidoreductase [Novosphingobium malaysiense]KHK89113.1 oxidoreductase [Novosphingobium malaysiense]
MSTSRIPNTFRGRLTGKTAIVTGAGTRGEGFGTGRAIAALFAGEGANVCLVDRDHDAVMGTLRIIEDLGGRAFVVEGDVTSEADCKRFAGETRDRFGGVDILVNNVGIASAADKLDDLDLAQWQRIFDVNLKSAVLMGAQAVPMMRAQGGGAIVNVVSIAGMLAYGGMAYGPSKAAMIHLTREIALAHGRDGIRANAIAPGHIYTPMLDGLIPDELRAARRKAGPIGIEGDAWDIAHAALFLASDEARFITGTCLPVDGGVTTVGSLAAASLLADES